MEVQRLLRKKERVKSEGNLNSLFSCCKELADIFFRLEKYDDALKEYEDLLEVSECLGNKMDVARTHRMIGEVYCAKNDFDSAIKHQLIHLVTSQDENDIVEEQRALATLGRTHFLFSESFTSPCTQKTHSLKKANSYYMQSLSVCERLRDDMIGYKQRMEMRARLFLNLGLVYDSQRSYEKAINSLSKAISICKKLDLFEDLYRTYAAIASVYHHHGDNNNSIANYDMAISVASRLTDKVELLCECLPLKADVLLDLPDFRGARQVLLKAYKLKTPNIGTREEVEKKLRIVAAMCECEEKLLDIAGGENHRERKKLYESIGDMGVALGNYDLALTYYHLMLECVEKSGNDRKELIECYVSLSQTYSDNGNFEKALEYFEKQLNLEKENSSEACKTCLNIADCFEKLGQFDSMVEYYQSAKEYANKGQNQKLQKKVIHFMNAAMINCGKLPISESMDSGEEEIDEDEASSPEAEENPDEFGADIDLDNLTDEDGGDNEEFDRPKPSRTRGKTSSNMKRNEKGETPLHTAAISGNKNLVKKLLEQGHSVDVKDYSGWTPLHEACNHGFKDIVCMLLDHGAPINDRGGPMCDGVTPLLDAASNGCLEIMDLLIERGASPLMRNNKGESVIDCMAAWRQRYINDVGKDLDAVNMTHYKSLYDKLKLILEKAGQKVSQVPISEEKILPRTRRLTPEKNPSGDWQRSLEYRRLSECKKSPPVGAATEYETAIKALRHRSKPEKISNIAKVSFPALLQDSEDIGDDWLENDLQPQLKKRRTSKDVYTSGLSLRNRIMSPPSSPRIDDSDNSNDSEGKSLVEEPAMSHAYNEMPSVSGSSSNKLKVMNTTRKKQISLMTTGVTREKVRRSNENNQNQVTDEILSSSSETSSSQSAMSSAAPTPVPPETTSVPESRPNSTIVARIKVRIEGKLFLIAVPSSTNESLTVKWLAQQAVKRYYNLEGVEPVIQLTDDGALLDESDPLEILYSSSEVIGVVQSWKMDTIRERYAQACKKSNTCEDVALSNILEACQATSEVILEDLFLTHSELEPVLKALSCHLPLRVLVLSGNKLTDQTFKIVVECMEKLPYLEHLDISNTNLSSSRLNLLVESVKKTGVLKNLQKFFVGYNPLNDSVKALTSLLEYLPGLTKLSLASCGLCHKYFRFPSYFSLDRIEWLDVSDNKLGDEGVRAILSRLDANTVCHLAMRHVGPPAVQELALFLQQYQPPSLTFIDISYCSPSPEHLHQFIKGIEMTPRLETLLLDGTPLSNEALQSILKTDLTHLSLGGTEVSEEITTKIKSLAITSCANQSRGKPGPFGCYIDSF